MSPAATNARRILVVEDEVMVAEVVQRYLRRDGHVVDVVHDGHAALEAFVATQPQLVVLDVMLPGLDGLELCRRIRAAGDTAIILLTARDGEADRINGLAIGADDYVTKPFSPGELAARVQAVLRRTSTAVRADRLRFGNVAVDEQARAVEVGGVRVGLTAREFDLLVHLARHPGRVFTREQLLTAVWSDEFEGDDGTVTVHIRRLRAKVEDDASNPAHLKTVWGVGYRFDP
ncbi:MAG: response regulator transcription factor [Dehalococcoidia bacterium]